MEGDLTWMWTRDGSTGTFNYMRTPAADLDIFNDPLWYNLQQSAASNLAVGRTGRDVGTLSDVYEDRNAGKQVVRYLTGAGQAATKTRKKSDTELRDAYGNTQECPMTFHMSSSCS